MQNELKIIGLIQNQPLLNDFDPWLKQVLLDTDVQESISLNNFGQLFYENNYSVFAWVNYSFFDIDKINSESFFFDSSDVFNLNFNAYELSSFDFNNLTTSVNLPDAELSDDEQLLFLNTNTESGTTEASSYMPSSSTETLSTTTETSSESPNQVIDTIHDDDQAKVSIDDMIVNEADGLIEFTATLDHGVQGGFSVDVQIGSTMQTLTFLGNAGETQKVQYNFMDDSIVDVNETINVTMSNLIAPQTNIQNIDISDTAIGTIIDDDLIPSDITEAAHYKNIDLHNLLNGQGIEIVKAGNETEIYLRNAGDVNNDGINDLLASNSTNGKVFYIQNRFSTLENTVEDENIDNEDVQLSFSVRFEGETSTSGLGYTISSVGDTNGDGFDDFVIGVQNNVNNPQLAASYLVYGEIAPGSLFNGFDELPSYYIGNYEIGFKVSYAGDINGDGLSDFLIFEPESGDHNGRVTIKFHNNSSEVEISDSTESNILNSAKSIGDVNGDGYSDILIQGSNTSYIVYGQAGPNSKFSPMLEDLENITNEQGVKITAPVQFANIGDINADGYEDLVVVDPSYETNKGVAYLIFGDGTYLGNELNNELDYSSEANIVIEGLSTISEHNFGLDVGYAGDMNGDGIDDFFVTALDSLGAEQAYVIFGDRNPTSIFSNFADNLEGINGDNGFIINNLPEQPLLESLGDINGDGIDDLLISSSDNLAGRDFVIYGEMTEDAILGSNEADELLGTGDSNVIRGGAGDDDIKGGAGDDILFGGHGNDQLDGGAGEDILHYDFADTLRIDGGSDFDTLALDSGNLDLTGFASENLHINSIEHIDMKNADANTLELDLENIIDLYEDNYSPADAGLFISGDSTDEVKIIDGTWTEGGTIDKDGTSFQEYSTGATNLFIDITINDVEITTT